MPGCNPCATNVDWADKKGVPKPRELEAGDDLNKFGNMPTKFVSCGCKKMSKQIAFIVRYLTKVKNERNHYSVLCVASRDSKLP